MTYKCDTVRKLLKTFKKEQCLLPDKLLYQIVKNVLVRQILKTLHFFPTFLYNIILSKNMCNFYDL